MTICTTPGRHRRRHHQRGCHDFFFSISCQPLRESQRIGYAVSRAKMASLLAVDFARPNLHFPIGSGSVLSRANALREAHRSRYVRPCRAALMSVLLHFHFRAASKNLRRPILISSTYRSTYIYLARYITPARAWIARLLFHACFFDVEKREECRFQLNGSALNRLASDDIFDTSSPPAASPENR